MYWMWEVRRALGDQSSLSQATSTNEHACGPLLLYVSTRPTKTYSFCAQLVSEPLLDTSWFEPLVILSPGDQVTITWSICLPAGS